MTMADTALVEMENKVETRVSPERVAAEHSAESLEELYDQQFAECWQIVQSAEKEPEISYIELERLDLIRDVVFEHPDGSFE